MSQLLKFSVKPPQNEVVSQQQQAVQEQRICPHFFSPSGCALGEYCQFLHTMSHRVPIHPSTTSNASSTSASSTPIPGANASSVLAPLPSLQRGNSSVQLGVLSRATSSNSFRRATPTTSQRPLSSTSASSTPISFGEPRNLLSSHRWFWRQLAKDFHSAVDGLGWKPFEGKLESDIESAYIRWKEEDGPAVINSFCLNKYTCDFDKMVLYTGVDGGSRRSIQRVRADSGFFWFASQFEGKAAMRFSSEVSAVLEREYTSGNTTTFGLRIGPRAAGLVEFDSMQIQVLPEIAVFLSSVLQKEARIISESAAEKEALKGSSKKSKKKKKKNKHKKNKEKDDETNNKTLDDQFSPPPRRGNLHFFENDNENEKDNNKRNSPFSHNSKSDSDNSDSDNSDDSSGSDNSDNESSSDLSEGDIEIIAQADDHDDDKENLQEEEGQKKDGDQKKFKKRKSVVEAELALKKLSFLFSNDSFSPQTVLTMRLHRQPLQVTAACAASDFFGIPKLRERAVFVADSGAVIFMNPALGPDVFSRDELQNTVLPGIRSAVLGTTTPQSLGGEMIPPHCGERCLAPETATSVSDVHALVSCAHHMHAAVHRCAVGRTVSDCFLHEIAAATTGIGCNTTNPEIIAAKRFMSVSAQMRARLHDVAFSHPVHTTGTTHHHQQQQQFSSSMNSNIGSTSIRGTTTAAATTAGDAGQARWFSQQQILRQFRHYAELTDVVNANAAASSSSNKKAKQHHQVPDYLASSGMLPIVLLAEGTQEWDFAVSKLLLTIPSSSKDLKEKEEAKKRKEKSKSENKKETNDNDDDDDEEQEVVEKEKEEKEEDKEQEEEKEQNDEDEENDNMTAILQLRPRIRRIDRYDLCQRYRRARNEIQAAWLRVDRSAALESAERICYIPGSHDEVSSLMSPNDNPSNSKRIVYLNFTAAVLAAKATIHVGGSSPSSHSSGGTVGIIVALTFLGPSAIAKNVNDRLFQHPSVVADNDPIAPEFRCVLNTSAMVEKENNFATLFCEALFCPLYLVSISDRGEE